MSQISTIGHSNKSLGEFLDLLHARQLEMIADVRRFPASRRYPHFAKDSLARCLAQSGIGYLHMPELGGRRSPRPDSRNTNWRVAGFRGYADYMETAEFQTAIAKLTFMASQKRLAFMCAEALWWQCHRSLIADHLKSEGWIVTHILSTGKTQEHPYTSAARIVDGQLSYTMETLFQ